MQKASQFDMRPIGSTKDTGTLNFDSDQNQYSSLGCLFTPGIHFILLKGQPGSGKTTLAIELLAMQGQGMYVSTRVSLDLLSKQNPKLQHLIKEGKIHEFYSKNDEQIDNKIGFADSRLDTAKEIMHSLLELCMGQKAKNDQQDQLVVLDSWDAIAGMMDPIERKKFERSLLAVAVANKLRLVFVSETNEVTDSDYMVDAILELEDEVLSDRRVRKLVWKKLRGQEIPQRSQLYTLHNGTFDIFSPNPLIPLRRQTKQFPAIPHSESKFSTGNSEADDHLLYGGLERGSIISLELGPNVRIAQQWPLGLSIALNFIANGGCSVFLPPFELHPEISKKAIQEHQSQGKNIEDSLRIIHASRSQASDPCFINVDDESLDETFRKTMEEVSYMKSKCPSSSSKGVEGHCFYYVTVDAAENLFGTLKPKSAMQEFERMVKMNEDVALMVVTDESEFGQMVKKSSDIHLKFIMIDSSPIIYAEKPPSPHFFHFGYDFNVGYPKVCLTPIV